MLLGEINWNVISIAIVVVGCWLLAEFIESFEDRKRMRRRFARLSEATQGVMVLDMVLERQLSAGK